MASDDEQEQDALTPSGRQYLPIYYLPAAPKELPKIEGFCHGKDSNLISAANKLEQW
jgi:hypothetical protein